MSDFIYNISVLYIVYRLMSIDLFWKFLAYFHLLTIILTNYRFIPFVPGLLRRPSTHSYSSNSTSIILHKGRQQTVLSLRSFTDCCHIRESSQEGLCANGASSNASTVSPVATCICFAVALRFVSCLFPHAGKFWMQGCIPFIRKNWNSSKRSSWRLYG